MAPKGKSEDWCCRKSRCTKLATVAQSEPYIEFNTAMERHFINLNIRKQRVKCLVDSGASICCISKYLLDRINSNAIIQRSTIFSVVEVCGEVHPVLRETILELTFGDYKVQQKFRIFGDSSFKNHSRTRLLESEDSFRR